MYEGESSKKCGSIRSGFMGALFFHGLRGCRIERLMKEKKLGKKGNKSDNSRIWDNFLTVIKSLDYVLLIGKGNKRATFLLIVIC